MFLHLEPPSPTSFRFGSVATWIQREPGVTKPKRLSTHSISNATYKALALTIGQWHGPGAHVSSICHPQLGPAFGRATSKPTLLQEGKTNARHPIAGEHLAAPRPFRARFRFGAVLGLLVVLLHGISACCLCAPSLSNQSISPPVVFQTRVLTRSRFCSCFGVRLVFAALA